MSSLLTRVVARRALTWVPRRNENSLIMAGPPLTKVTTKEKSIVLGLFFLVPMLYPMYIMANLQKYNGSNRSAGQKKKKADKK